MQTDRVEPDRARNFGSDDDDDDRTAKVSSRGRRDDKDEDDGRGEDLKDVVAHLRRAQGERSGQVR